MDITLICIFHLYCLLKHLSTYSSRILISYNMIMDHEKISEEYINKSWP